MSNVTIHAMAGDIIGKVVGEIPNEKIDSDWIAALLAFGAAFASHPLLDKIDNDYTPDWTRWQQDAQEFARDAPYLAVQIGGLAALVVDVLQEKDPRKLKTRLAGILGSLAPDIIDAVHSLKDKTAWLKGEHLMPWHRADSQPWLPQQTREQSMALTGAITLLKLSWRF